MLFRGAAAIALACVAAAPTESADSTAFRARLPEDEIIYFVLPDRFENGDAGNDRGERSGNRLTTGFDPTHKGFYHGGDLRGLTARLDYIEALGATAIWLGPIYKNKPVQGTPGRESAGYHGYWITDFQRVDPHFGTNEEMKRLVAQAHDRGIKVYLDVIVNHTADVIAYRECPRGACAYRSRADYPYTRLGGVVGAEINAGFAGDAIHTRENFARLTRPDFAYTPFVAAAETGIKRPAWLNDLLKYHNRGDSSFKGESSTMGDFAGLDDLMTEDPQVVQGMIDIYGWWIDEVGIDGFRIDTALHVNPEFWTAFAPAMLERAAARGIPNFHLFGEVATEAMDPALLARFVRPDRLPSVLDFAFRAAVLASLADDEGNAKLAQLFAADEIYHGGPATTRRLPTFISNHDAGRFPFFARKSRPEASDLEILQRTRLAHAMTFTLRGVPVVYAGDEQGFIGDGGDQDAREDLFPSQVEIYNDNDLLGTEATTKESNFDRTHPLYREIAELSRLRRTHAALRRGDQIVRRYDEKPGLFAVSRIDPETGQEILIAFNTSTARLESNVEVDYRSTSFTSLRGSCAPTTTAPGSYRVVLESLSYVLCSSE